MSTHPYIPLYVDDYEAATAHLTVEEDGLYNRLLRLAWRTPGCSLPTDHAWIARKVRMTVDDFERVGASLLDEFFKVQRGRYVQRRLRDEYENISRKKAARQNAGKKGGAAKALKSKEIPVSNASDLLPDTRAFPEPYPEPYSDKKEDLSSERSERDALEFEPGPKPKPKPKVKRSAPRSRLCPDDWVPSQSVIDFGIAEGLTPQQVANEIKKLCDWEFKNPVSDWDRAARNWLRRAAERTSNERPGQTNARPLSATDARRAATETRRNSWARLIAAGCPGEGAPDPDADRNVPGNRGGARHLAIIDASPSESDSDFV